MSRIPRSAVLRAIRAVEEMSAQQKLALADEIFASQPNLLGSVLVLRNLGVSPAKQEFALEMLFLCFQAMKESGLLWPLITVDDQAHQMRRDTAVLRFFASMDRRPEQLSSARQYIDSHPEQELYAWVMTQSRDWLMKSPPEESDKHVIQAVVNMVSCISFIPIPADSPRSIQ
jgi:hypothetical protein